MESAFPKIFKFTSEMQANEAPNLPLMQNQAYVLPSTTSNVEAQPARRQCRCKCRKWCKNHKKVLKVNLILHLIFAVLGVLLVTPLITVLRIVSSVVGLRSLKKKNASLLVAFIGMSVYDILLTLSAPFLSLGTLLTLVGLGGMGHQGHGACDYEEYEYDGRRGIIGGGLGFFSILFILLHGLIVLIIQIISLVKALKFYKQEKSKFSNPQPEVEQEIPSVPVQPVSMPYVVQQVPEQQPIAYDSSMIVSLPPPPQQVQQVRENVQQPVVHPASFGQELALLGEMGFGDRVKNIELLKKHKGNVQNVIQEYVSQ